MQKVMCCHTCGRVKRKSSKSRCTRCGHAWYCSTACQKQDWWRHKDTCDRIVAEKNAACLVDGAQENASMPAHAVDSRVFFREVLEVRNSTKRAELWIDHLGQSAAQHAVHLQVHPSSVKTSMP